MRLHLRITPSDEVIPFDNISLLTGTIHKWLGKNKEHGELSMYSFSWLSNGRKTRKGLIFEKETSFFISAHDPKLIKTIIKGIQSDPTMFYGLQVFEVILQEDPDLTDRNLFYAASPIFIKRNTDKRTEHITISNDIKKANACLKETLIHKMEKVGLYDDTLDIHFDTSYANPKTKVVKYKGIENKANICPVIIEGKPETKAFAWNVGLGNSTGIGFGAIK